MNYDLWSLIWPELWRKFKFLSKLAEKKNNKETTYLLLVNSNVSCMYTYISSNYHHTYLTILSSSLIEGSETTQM